MKYKVGMILLGCPKNQVDGELMLEKLNKSGFEIASSIEDSDIMIINTCGFIEDAKREAIDTILEVAEYKMAGLITAIVVTGCLAQRYQDEILKEIPEVDSVIGIGADSDIVKVCQKVLVGVKTSFYPDRQLPPLEGERMLSTSPHWAYLKLSDGCDNKCSYCAIPLIRGGYNERPIESIINEANSLADKGIKELILIAQDTTKYGLQLYGEYKLAELLKELVKIDGIKWIRLYYCYPDRITDELIDVIANEDKICSYIDIPLQHCNENILRSMNRNGSYDTLKSLLNKMRDRIDGLTLRTTFMVGFPGESEQDFSELCRFVKEMKFDKMGCFSYSPEEDTPAFDFECQIDDEIKKHRAEVLMDIQYGITEQANKEKIGNVYDVIVDTAESSKYTGRAYFDSPEIDSGIIFTSDVPLSVGEFVKVRITDYDGYDLIGEKI
ncbi:MAG: 30S ribosomal protein S12 methylthiotransferase RimO [Clostridiales bacterium]|nr:30S ribosomal protein S12 methylthiotransferase RimO [Clostridiales bacterium]